ncbi:MAG: hypothetical protein V7723_18670 [Sneathiella sp.]|uniref:hypothetical protein n=1 Tax=Sneathiella sp. TaxID=1964365 RepID=UPI003002874C
MDYPINNGDDLKIEDLGIRLNADDAFSIQIKDYVHTLKGEELIVEMKDQLDVRGAVRNALLRKANKDILAGLKKGRLRLDDDSREGFDLNILIWFADKALKGQHQQYLVT